MSIKSKIKSKIQKINEKIYEFDLDHPYISFAARCGVYAIPAVVGYISSGSGVIGTMHLPATIPPPEYVHGHPEMYARITNDLTEEGIAFSAVVGVFGELLHLMRKESLEKKIENEKPKSGE